MVAVNHDWLRVTRSEPCPICQKSSWCAVTADGSLARCQRVESDRPAPGDFGGWFHRLGDPRPDYVPPPKVEKPKLPLSHWRSKCEEMSRSPLAADGRRELAVKLGVSIDSLEALGVGVGYERDRRGEQRRFFSFPERDELGRPVGCLRRYDDGAKFHMAGSSRGVYMAKGWDKNPGPILLPEGGSDTAAMLTMGLCVLGRAQCLGGTTRLKNILIDYPSRGIVVIGENDCDPSKRGQAKTAKNCPANCGGCQLCWPGKHGARATAYKLSELLKRDVQWRMVPGAKDTRAWVQQHGHPDGLAFLRGLILPVAWLRAFETQTKVK